MANLANAIDETVFDKKGTLLVPAFALGRTQEVLFDLHYLFATHPVKYANVPLYSDANLAQLANRIYADHLFETDIRAGEIHYPWANELLFGLLKLDRSFEGHQYLARCALQEALNPGGLTDRGWRDSSYFGNCESDVIRNWWSRTQRVSDPCFLHSLPRPAIIVTGGGMCNGGACHPILATSSS